MRVGVFGGTFDPPHIGHQILAAEALHQLKIDKLLWMLTPIPPHKLGIDHSDIAHRKEMVQFMVNLDPRFELSEVEISRPGPHYALDTMRILRREYPEDKLFYLMGGDSLRDLHTWHQPEEFIDSCDKIIVMRRPGARLGLRIIYSRLSSLRKKVIFLASPLIEISASDLRARKRRGEDIWHFINPQVNSYIQKHGLYSAVIN